MCEMQQIHFVHVMAHPEYPDELHCGCDCAGKMSDDYTGADRRDKAMRNAASGKKRWLSRAWRESAKGNPFINARGFNVVVFRKVSGWGFRVKDRATDYELESRNYLATEDAAKLRAFD